MFLSSKGRFMINKQKMMKIGFLSILASVPFLSQGAAVAIPDRTASRDASDMIVAIPRDMDHVFGDLQQQIAQQLGGMQLSCGTTYIPPYCMDCGLNFTKNHISGRPMVAHIKLKGFPIQDRFKALSLYNPTLFLNLNIPRSIKIKRLLAIRGKQERGKSDKLFIVAIFTDNLGHGFAQIARTLDEISGVEHSQGLQYRDHITYQLKFPLL